MQKDLKIQEHVALAPLSTLQVGGEARYFCTASTIDDISAAVEHAAANGLDIFFLGGGSNIVVSDSGFPGLVLRVALRGIERNDGLITVQAGENWDELVADCVGRGLAGIECMSGIPGTVGATPIQNVGAYGQEVAETIERVRSLDLSTGEILDLSNADCGFAYRNSIFNSTMRGRYVVLSVTFRLTPGGRPKIVYKDLQDRFSGTEPTLGETREAVIAIRRSKSMVIDANDSNSKTAGSFFKNPIVRMEIYERIAAAHDSVPHFSSPDGNVKIPAAWLIENAGFRKGYVRGNAGISTNHSLAIINRGGATAAEVIALKDEIIAEVAAKFDIDLQPEPIFVGF